MPAAVAETAAPDMPKVSLDDAVRKTLTQNPTARTADEEIRRARGLMEQARAASFPTLIGTGTYTQYDSNRLFGPGAQPIDHQLAANITANVPLINPRAWLTWAHAGDQIDVARANAAETRRTLAVSVARAYLQVIAQKRLVETQVRARDSAKAHFDYAHARLVGGVGNRIDEVRAAQELATDESLVSNAIIALVRAREALGVFVANGGPVDTVDEVYPVTLPNERAALDDVPKLREDVRALDVRRKSTERVVKDNWADLSPSLNGVLSGFYQDPSAFTPPSGWYAQLVLTVPFYDGGLRYGQWHEREAVAAQAREELEGTLRQARSDVRTAYEEVTRADEALRTARDAARLAKEALDLANLAYRAGATTNIEVIDAERRARDAETQATIAEDSARQARVDLLSAAGRFPGPPR